MENPLIDQFIDWLSALLTHQAVIGPILLLALEESGIPLPVPGDVIIAYSGYNISRGLLSYPMAIAAIMFSILLGSSILYWLSVKWGNTLVIKFGKFLHLKPERLKTIEEKFKKYGPLVIIFGRHVPGFRIPITVFAGMSGVKYRTFILSTLISTLFWAMFYLDLGIRLGPRVRFFLKVSSHRWIFVLLFIFLLILALIYWKRRGK